jgi:hypothetical protein
VLALVGMLPTSRLHDLEPDVRKLLHYVHGSSGNIPDDSSKVARVPISFVPP